MMKGMVGTMTQMNLMMQRMSGVMGSQTGTDMKGMMEMSGMMDDMSKLMKEMAHQMKKGQMPKELMTRMHERMDAMNKRMDALQAEGSPAKH